MEPTRARFLRTLAMSGLAVVGTLVFALIYLISGSISLENGVWPVFAGGMFCSSILLGVAFGGSKLLELMRDPTDDETVSPNYTTTRKSKNISTGLWVLFLGAGFMGVLFAGLFTPIVVSFTIWSLFGHVLLSLLNGVVFTIGGTVLMLMLEQLLD